MSTAAPPSGQTTMTIPQAIGLATRLLGEGAVAQARAIAAQILNAAPTDPDALTLGAMAAERSGDREEAARLTEAAALAHFQAGRARMDAKDLAGAFACYRRSAALLPDRGYVYNCAGESLLFRNLFNDSIPAYVRALRLNPDDRPSFGRLVDLHALLNRWSECRRIALGALMQTPEAGMLHYVHSLACLQLDRAEEARRSIERAIRLDGRRAAFLFQYGQTLRDLGRMEEALAIFREAARLDPDRTEAYFGAAFCAAVAGGVTGGASGIDAAELPENAARADLMTARAAAALAQGNWETAAEAYAQALAARPGDAALVAAMQTMLADWKAALRVDPRPAPERNPDWVKIECRLAETMFRPLHVAEPRWSGIPGTVPARPAAGPATRRRVWDCFMFFNELDMLELRLHEMAEVADRFVLVESPWTHQGGRKELVYWENRERFAAFADRIVHVIADERREGLTWDQESYQRNCILNGLGDAAAEDVVIVADVDEIPRPDLIRRIAGDDRLATRLNALAVTNYNYFINFASYQPCIRPIVLPCGLLRRLGVNLARHLTVRSGQQIVPVIPDAGWHFSWFGGVDVVWRKLQAFCHLELLGPVTTKEQLREKLEAGDFQILRQTLEGRFVPIDDSFPAHVRRNTEEMRRLGWIFDGAGPGDPRTAA